MRKTSTRGLAVGATLLVVLAVGCGSLAPYDEVECDPCEDACKDQLVCEQGRCIDPENPDACRESLSLCGEYCGTVMDSCPQNYSSLEACLGVCEQLPVGDLDEPTLDNSVHCRLNAARAAAAAEDPERERMCQAAGPGGNGDCGTNCESYCLLVEQVCDEIVAPLPDCLTACEALGDSERFHVGMSPVDELDHSGDTVQCRLVHLSSAASVGSVDTEVHCPHADIHATLWCTDAIPTCEAYCRISGAACQGADAVYPSEETCLATCAVLELGEVDDSTEDTIGCRTWHAKSALSDASSHCPHTGPTGDGHCGHDEADSFGACRPYCRVLESACPEDFSEAWTSSDACVEACDRSEAQFGASLDQGYSVDGADRSGDTLGCRVSHAVRALADPGDGAWCDAAFGGPPCEAPGAGD